MDINSVKNDIKNNTIKPLYIFTGPEVAVQDIYINKIKTLKNAQIKRLDTLADIYTMLNKKSFISSCSVFILRDSKDFLTEEKTWADLESGKLQKDNVVILQYTSIDKRSKAYKHFKDNIIEFEHLTDLVLSKYIRKQANLSDRVVDTMIAACDSDYSRILLELDKIKNYAKANGFDDDEAAMRLFKDGTIFFNPKDAIFEFVDAVCRRKTTLAFTLLQDCWAVGESPIVLLSVLYNNLKQMLQVQTYEGNDIVNGTGLTSYQVKITREKCGKYKPGELVDALRKIRNIEKGIKTGEIEQDIAIEFLLIYIM